MLYGKTLPLFGYVTVHIYIAMACKNGTTTNICTDSSAYYAQNVTYYAFKQCSKRLPYSAKL